MTNFEYLLENEKGLVKDILTTYANKLAIDKDNKIKSCNEMSCAECKFWVRSGLCKKESLAWLDAEYEEPLPETVKIPRDTPKHTPIWVKNYESSRWKLRFFSHFDSEDYPICFADGNFDNEIHTLPWLYAKPFEIGVNPNEDEKEAEE